MSEPWTLYTGPIQTHLGIAGAFSHGYLSCVIAILLFLI